MKDEIVAIAAAIKDLQHRVRGCIAATTKYDADNYDDAVWARVDLAHAEKRLDDAAHMINRLIVNGRKPWDAQ